MKLWDIFKANFGSIKAQRELEAAMAVNDQGKIRSLIGENIASILKAALTKRDLKILEIINTIEKEKLNQLLTAAFARGWTRSGKPNLSNAMDEVVREARNAIKAFKESGLEKDYS